MSIVHSSGNNPVIGGILAYLSLLIAQAFIVRTSFHLLQVVQSENTLLLHRQQLTLVDIVELQECTCPWIAHLDNLYICIFFAG